MNAYQALLSDRRLADDVACEDKCEFGRPQIEEIYWKDGQRKDADMTNRSGHRPPAARRDEDDEAPVVRRRIWLEPTMTITRLALFASSTLAATITIPATAHADFDYRRFQSPSGDILCVMLRDHDIYDQARYGKGNA